MRRKVVVTVSAMMLVVTLVFAVCNLPAAILNIVEIVDPSFYLTHQTVYYMLNDTSNLLVVVNCGSTVIIYYRFSRRYRRIFRSVICRGRTASEDTNLDTGLSVKRRDNSAASFSLATVRRLDAANGGDRRRSTAVSAVSTARRATLPLPTADDDGGSRPTTPRPLKVTVMDEEEEPLKLNGHHQLATTLTNGNADSTTLLLVDHSPHSNGKDVV